MSDCHINFLKGDFEMTTRLSFYQLVLIYLALTLLVLFIMFPIFWMLITSFQRPEVIRTQASILLFQNITFDNYKYVIFKTSIPQYLFNSLYIALVVAFIGTVISIFAGYSLSRFKFKGKNFFIHCLMFTRMFPWVLAIIPIFTLMFHLRIIDTHYSLIIMYTVAVIPFNTLMLSTYFSTVPKEIEESAMLDGCSLLNLLFRVMLPIIKPGIVAVIVYSIITAMQEFVLALILLTDNSLYTLPVGLFMFIGTHGEVAYGPLMAALVFLTIPLVLAFVYFQKFLIQGLMAGAIKA
jgi:multiple sugar transport system permease protein